MDVRKFYQSKHTDDVAYLIYKSEFVAHYMFRDRKVRITKPWWFEDNFHSEPTDKTFDTGFGQHCTAAR